MPTSKSVETRKVTKRKQSSKAGGKGGKSSKLKAAGEKNKGEGPRGQSQSCHQCRQSIHSSKGVSEVKSGKERLKCSTCTRYWCEQCLHNRYGIVKAEVDVTVWTCPVCDRNCNCSLCRKKEGKLATGILTPLVKNAGFGNVSDFLDKGTDDIAKVLQWKSPDIAETVRQRPSQKKPGSRKQATPSPSSGPSRKQKRRRSDMENSVSQSASGCRGDDLSCHGSRGPKRRKLNHSRYSITLEEDPVLSLETPSVTKVDAAAVNDESVNKDSHGESSVMDQSPATSDHEEMPDSPIGFHRRSTRRKATPKWYGAEHGSKQGEEVDEFGDFIRRSPRRKVAPQKYVAEDFREGLCSPTGGKMKRNDCLSPNRSPKPSQVSFAMTEENGTSDLSEKKQEELEALKEKRFGEIHSSRMEEKQKLLEGREREREEQRLCRQKVLERKASLREEEKARKLAEQEKLRMARSLLKEAKRSSQKRRREREKERKQRELQEMKEKNAGERKRRKELCSVPVMGGAKVLSTAVAGEEELALVDDSPENCEVSGIPALPELPALDLHVSAQLAPGMLVVCEFLHTFAGALQLKRKLSVDDLFALLSGGRGLSEVYLALLRVVMEEEEDQTITKELKPTKKQRDLEEIARQYLHKAGRNGFVTLEGDSACLEESVVILEHLCQEALRSGVIMEYMDSARERAERSKREHRTKERDKTKQISDELKQLCEGGCSLGDIEDKRRDFTSELTEIRTAAEFEQYACGLALRNTHLGEDRYGRTYWHLQCFPGVLVEVARSHEEGGEGLISCWCTINTEELMEKFLECLHPQGRRERQLYGALELHKAEILSSLTSSKQETAMKRFYGRR